MQIILPNGKSVTVISNRYAITEKKIAIYPYGKYKEVIDPLCVSVHAVIHMDVPWIELKPHQITMHKLRRIFP